MIEQLKNNRVPWYLLTDEERACFKKAGKDNCLWYVSETIQWTNCGSLPWDREIVYRIKSNYQPEPEIMCCKIIPSPGGWQLGYYKKDNWYFLWEAQADPDFAGFEFEDTHISHRSAWTRWEKNNWEHAKYVLFRSK